MKFALNLALLKKLFGADSLTKSRWHSHKPAIMLLISFTCFSINVSAQDSIYIKKNAVQIDQPDSLSEEIYKLIKDYRLLMVGELHGTNEPARLVLSLARLFVKHGDHVQIGLEIPHDQMKTFLDDRLNENIYKSDFFSAKSVDGRASYAWADIIAKLNNDRRVDFFFFDINGEEANAIVKIKDSNGQGIKRDSAMYLKVKKRIREHPNWKTITLSGNLHNILVPRKGRPFMGLYLSEDRDLKISGKILSLNHVYGEGTMLNNIGDGVKENKMDDRGSIFARAVNYDNYLLLLPKEGQMRYTGIYFSRKMTAAKLVSPK